jgi:hypothetical protein
MEIYWGVPPLDWTTDHPDSIPQEAEIYGHQHRAGYVLSLLQANQRCPVLSANSKMRIELFGDEVEAICCVDRPHRLPGVEGSGALLHSEIHLLERIEII